MSSQKFWAYRKVLEKPRSEYVGGDFGEDASLFLILLPVRVVVFLPCPLPTPNAGITSITWNKKNPPLSWITRTTG